MIEKWVSLNVRASTKRIVKSRASEVNKSVNDLLVSMLGQPPKASIQLSIPVDPDMVRMIDNASKILHQSSLIKEPTPEGVVRYAIDNLINGILQSAKRGQ